VVVFLTVLHPIAAKVAVISGCLFVDVDLMLIDVHTTQSIGVG
jgi:hypothetical protein